MMMPCSASPPPVRHTGQATIESRAGDGTVTVFIGGELDLMTMPLLCERLAPVLAARPRRLILDLSGTEFIDCGSARVIAGTGRLLPPGQRPVIRGARPWVLRVFRLTGLDARCEIED